MNDDEIQDPLKALKDIMLPDPRQNNFALKLDDKHALLSALNLNKSVPLDVRQLFETAKNISLYSWFCYRFHQAAELIGYSALEMALRERFNLEPTEKKPKKKFMGLSDLMLYAKGEGWIKNHKFPSLRHRGVAFAENKKAFELIKSHNFDVQNPIEIPEPNEEDIIEALEHINIVQALAASMPKIRNDLAHGSTTLHPNSILTLERVAEVINQVYPV